MEGNKNLNYGNLNSEGGDIHIGDVVNDLSVAYNQVYKEQLLTFEKLLHSFKPQTAKLLLEQLDIDISQKEKIEDIVRSKIVFLKAICNSFLQANETEVSLEFIKAYNLNKSDFKLKTIASFEYLNIKEPSKAAEIAAEILKIEEFNPEAWAANILNNPSSNLESLLSQVPEIVRGNITFRRIIYFYSKQTSKYEDLHIAFPKFQIPLTLVDYDEKPLSFHNYKNRLFLIDSILSSYLQNNFISFHKTEIENRDEILQISNLLSAFIMQLSETEIPSKFPSIQFYDAYFKYRLHSDNLSVFEMVKYSEKMPSKPVRADLLTANCLQQIDECDKAIEIIEQISEKDVVLIDLMMFCQIKKNNGAGYIKYAKEYLLKVDTVNKKNVYNHFLILQVLSEFGLLHEIDFIDLINGRTFDSADVRDFLILFHELLTGGKRKGIDEELVYLYNKLSESEEVLLVFFAICFYSIEDYIRCCNAYEKFVRTDIESRNLYCYILALFRSRNRHRDLLPLLQHWRLIFSFQEQLVLLEIDLRRQLFQWDEVIVCCEYMFEKDVFNEFNLVCYAGALHECDIANKSEKIQVLLLNMGKVTFSDYSYYSRIITVLQQSNFNHEALQLLYSQAINKSNARARTDFFQFSSFRDQNHLVDYQEVKVGVFVKYKMNDAISYVELTEGHEFFKDLIGKKVGENITLSGRFGGKERSITIIRIMNKYLSLYDEIMEEVRTSPLTEIQMESFDASEYIDGTNGKTILDLFEEIGGNRTEEEVQRNFIAYYNKQITFTHLVFLEFSDNYLKAYYNLVREKDGLTDINSSESIFKDIRKYNELILDFTSILCFFELSRSNGLSFKFKFTISSSAVSLIRAYAAEFPPFHSKEYVLDRNYFTELSNWVDENCQPKMPISKLDVLGTTEEKLKESITFNYALDNCCLLLDNENSILITDDSFYFMLFQTTPQKILNTDLFLSLCKSESDDN